MPFPPSFPNAKSDVDAEDAAVSALSLVEIKGQLLTVQAIPPAGPYQTLLVFDTTAVTGGLYAWNAAGAAYQKVGLAI